MTRFTDTTRVTTTLAGAALTLLFATNARAKCVPGWDNPKFPDAGRRVPTNGALVFEAEVTAVDLVDGGAVVESIHDPRLLTVEVTGPDGEPVAGALETHAREPMMETCAPMILAWRADAPLVPNTAYEMHVHADPPAGVDLDWIDGWDHDVSYVTGTGPADAVATPRIDPYFPMGDGLRISISPPESAAPANLMYEVRWANGSSERTLRRWAVDSDTWGVDSTHATAYVPFPADAEPPYCVELDTVFLGRQTIDLEPSRVEVCGSDDRVDVRPLGEENTGRVLPVATSENVAVSDNETTAPDATGVDDAVEARGSSADPVPAIEQPTCNAIGSGAADLPLLLIGLLIALPRRRHDRR